MSDIAADPLNPGSVPLADGGTPSGTPRRPASRAARLLIALGVVGLLVIVALGGLALVWDGEDPGGVTFVIPEGAAATLDYPTIDSAIDIPTKLVFERGDVLVLRNDDTATNRAGPWVLAAGETLRMRFDEPGEFFYLCSVDEAESVTVTVVEPTG